MTHRINITISDTTRTQAAALLRDQITPNFSGLVRKLIADAHRKLPQTNHLRRPKPARK